MCCHHLFWVYWISRVYFFLLEDYLSLLYSFDYSDFSSTCGRRLLSNHINLSMFEIVCFLVYLLYRFSFILLVCVRIPWLFQNIYPWFEDMSPYDFFCPFQILIEIKGGICLGFTRIDNYLCSLTRYKSKPVLVHWHLFGVIRVIRQWFHHSNGYGFEIQL